MITIQEKGKSERSFVQYPEIYKMRNFKTSYGDNMKTHYLFNFDIKNIIEKGHYSVVDGYQQTVLNYDDMVDNLMYNTMKNENVKYGITCKYVVCGLYEKR